MEREDSIPRNETKLKQDMKVTYQTIKMTTRTKRKKKYTQISFRQSLAFMQQPSRAPSLPTPPAENPSQQAESPTRPTSPPAPSPAPPFPIRHLCYQAWLYCPVSQRASAHQLGRGRMHVERGFGCYCLREVATQVGNCNCGRHCRWQIVVEDGEILAAAPGPG